MKRKISCLLLLVILISFVTSCDSTATKGKQVITEVDDVKSLSEQIGFDVTVPSTARNVTCTIIDNVISNVNFDYNSILFEFRASKVISGEQLYGINKKITSDNKLQIDKRAEVETYLIDGGGRIAYWYKDGTHYSLICFKTISNDALTEILDLMIK